MTSTAPALDQRSANGFNSSPLCANGNHAYRYHPTRNTVEFGIGEFLAAGLGRRLGTFLRLIGGEGVALARGEGDRPGKRCLVFPFGGMLPASARRAALDFRSAAKRSTSDKLTSGTFQGDRARHIRA